MTVFSFKFDKKNSNIVFTIPLSLQSSKFIRTLLFTGTTGIPIVHCLTMFLCHTRNCRHWLCF